MLEIKNISAGYGGKTVLHNVSLHVNAGQFVGIIGPNGCGKTTLLKVISGVLAANAGDVLVSGENIKNIPRRKLAKTMACMLQDWAMDLPFTVNEIVLMGRWPHVRRLGWETRRDHSIARRAMKSADVLHIADRPVTEISGGERQRVFIAMCLAQQPRILLLDEPTNHLDIAHQLSLLDLLAKLRRQTDMAIVSVFHDLNMASEYCDQLVLLNNGIIDSQGQPQEVITAGRIDRIYQTNIQVNSNPISLRPNVTFTANVQTGGEPK